MDSHAAAHEPVPDMVKTFVVYFYRHIREKNGARKENACRRPHSRTWRLLVRLRLRVCS